MISIYTREKQIIKSPETGTTTALCSNGRILRRGSENANRMRGNKSNNKFIFVLNLAIKSGGGRMVEEVPYGLGMCARQENCATLPAQSIMREMKDVFVQILAAVARQLTL